jgi:hypothetical protein
MNKVKLIDGSEAHEFYRAEEVDAILEEYKSDYAKMHELTPTIPQVLRDMYFDGGKSIVASYLSVVNFMLGWHSDALKEREQNSKLRNALNELIDSAEYDIKERGNTAKGALWNAIDNARMSLR